MIGGFRSDLSITRKTDGNSGNVSPGVCVLKSRINENGGNTSRMDVMHVSLLNKGCIKQLLM